MFLRNSSSHESAVTGFLRCFVAMDSSGSVFQAEGWFADAKAGCEGVSESKLVRKTSSVGMGSPRWRRSLSTL